MQYFFHVSSLDTPRRQSRRRFRRRFCVIKKPWSFPHGFPIASLTFVFNWVQRLESCLFDGQGAAQCFAKRTQAFFDDNQLIGIIVTKSDLWIPLVSNVQLC